MIGFEKKMRRVDRGLLDKVKEERCTVCSQSPVDPCHIKSRGSGGGDTWENVIPLDRKCHIQQHTIGIAQFAIKNPTFMQALWVRGWDVIREGGRWKLIRMK